MVKPASGGESSRKSEKLPRRRILRGRAVIHGVRTQGRRRSNRWMVLSVQDCRAEEKPRAAFLTPKRIGGATVRNRVRRRMREIFRRFIAAESESRLWVWSARTEAAQIGFQELKEAMLQLCAGQKSIRRSS